MICNPRKKREKGSVIVEASISLTAFMFAIVTVLAVVNILTAQVKIGCAINSAAKEISQYSYLYSLTGFNKTQNELYQQGKADTAVTTEIVDNISALYNQVEGLGNQLNDNAAAIKDSVADNTAAGIWNTINEELEESGEAITKTGTNIGNTGTKLQEDLKEVMNDPKGLLFGFAKLATSKGFDVVKSKLIAAPLAKVFSAKHLVDEKNGDPEAYLKHLGVVPNASNSYLGGLDFSESMLFPDGTAEIRITVDYKIKVLKLLPIDAELHFTQSAVTRGWPCGTNDFQPTVVKSGTGVPSGQDQNSSDLPDSLTSSEIAALYAGDPDDCETIEGSIFISDEEENSNETLLNEKKEFKDPDLEAKYQAYLKKKVAAGKEARDRLDWLAACQRYAQYTKRGDDYNKHCNALCDESGTPLYPYYEVTLKNGKRLDAYNPEKGWIVSRKATDLDKISEETYRGYLSEFEKKYKIGTEITSNKNMKAIKGEVLQGEYILEIPATNKNLPDIEYYEKIAAEYNVTLRFTPEQ